MVQGGVKSMSNYGELSKEEIIILLDKRNSEVRDLKEDVARLEKMLSKTIEENTNNNLPIPRLEIRYEKKKHELHCYLNLVSRNVINQIELQPLSTTVISPVDETSDDYVLFVREPFRAAGDLRNYMYELNLPGFLVYKNASQEIKLEDKDSLPGGLVSKMKKKNNTP